MLLAKSAAQGGARLLAVLIVTAKMVVLVSVTPV